MTPKKFLIFKPLVEEFALLHTFDEFTTFSSIHYGLHDKSLRRTMPAAQTVVREELKGFSACPEPIGKHLREADASPSIAAPT